MTQDSSLLTDLDADLPIYDSARRPHPFIEEFQELWRFRDLVLLWSARNIKLRYKRSALGVIWTLLEPLILMTILTIVFSNLFKFPTTPDKPYPIYLLSGLLLWDFFQRSTLQIIDETVASQSLAKHNHVPRSVFGVAAIVTHLVNWLIAMIPLMAIMIYFRHPFTWAQLTIFPGMLLGALFALGVGLGVATLGASFNDVHLSYKALLTGWLYATPIIYPFAIIKNETLRALFKLNPLYHLVDLVRMPAYLGHAAPWDYWLVGLGISVGSILAGWWIFTHWRNVIDYQT
jgi:ABC-type polysaccharide/polyol phosphate export permease